MGRKIRGIFYIAAILLAAGCGKEEETENVFSDSILIEVEAPRTAGIRKKLPVHEAEGQRLSR